MTQPEDTFTLCGRLMVLTKLLVVILVILIFLFRIWQSSGCREFSGFLFNPLSIKINVESQVALDFSLNRNISRFFHNKVTVGVFELTKSLISTFDTRFLLEILGPLGLALVILILIRIVKKKRIAEIVHSGLILIVAIFAIFSNDPKVSFYVLAFSWYSFAIRGLNYFWSNAKSLMILTILFFMTFWYFTFSWQ